MSDRIVAGRIFLGILSGLVLFGIVMVVVDFASRQPSEVPTVVEPLVISALPEPKAVDPEKYLVVYEVKITTLVDRSGQISNAIESRPGDGAVDPNAEVTPDELLASALVLGDYAIEQGGKPPWECE